MALKRKSNRQKPDPSLEELIRQQLVASNKMLVAAKKHLAEVKKHSRLVDQFIEMFWAQQKAAAAKKPKHQFYIEESSAAWIGRSIWNLKLQRFLTYRSSCDSSLDVFYSAAKIDMAYRDDLGLVKTRVN